MIDLPIPVGNKNPSIIDCLDHYVEGEILDGDNAWYDEDNNQNNKIQYINDKLPDKIPISHLNIKTSGRKILKIEKIIVELT